MKIFKNRQAAGKLLAKRLQRFKGIGGTIVLGIPRGGVVVASAVAELLKLPLDIIVTRKIGALTQPELALGAVDPDGEMVWDNELLMQLKFKIENLKLKIEDEKNEIKRREEIYRQDRSPLDVSNKTVILTDDGIATGATALSAIRYFKRHEAKKIILAVPVASKEAIVKVLEELRKFGEVIVLEIPEYFQTVGQFYQHFDPVSDEEVVQLMTRASSSR